MFYICITILSYPTSGVSIQEMHTQKKKKGRRQKAELTACFTSAFRRSKPQKNPHEAVKMKGKQQIDWKGVKIQPAARVICTTAGCLLWAAGYTHPPSTIKCCDVHILLSSEARNSAIAAISSGITIDFKHCASRIVRRAASSTQVCS